MTSLLELAELQDPDPEKNPDILPVDARLSMKGQVHVFQALFERAGAVTPTKEIIAGTGYALVEAFSSTPNTSAYIRVTATDGDLTMSMVTDKVEVRMPGAVLVPGKKIAEILKNAPTSSVSIEVLGNTATILSGRAQWQVQTPVGDSLPPSADVSSITTHPVVIDDFLSALGAARKAASTTIARASLMQISVAKGALTGIDGGRMHRRAVKDLPASLSLTIPLRAADEVTRLLKAADTEMMEIGGNSSHVVFKVNEDIVVAQRALADFPDIESQVLGPALTNPHLLSVDRVELLDAIKRVRVNADPDYQAIFLNLVSGRSTAEGKVWTLTISARDRLGNAAQETIDALWKGSSTSRSLCVNHRSLSDMLDVMDTERATFKIGDDTKTTRLPLYTESTVDGFTGWVAQMRPGFML